MESFLQLLKSFEHYNSGGKSCWIMESNSMNWKWSISLLHLPQFRWSKDRLGKQRIDRNSVSIIKTTTLLTIALFVTTKKWTLSQVNFIKLAYKVRFVPTYILWNVLISSRCRIFNTYPHTETWPLVLWLYIYGWFESGPIAGGLISLTKTLNKLLP